MPTAGPEPNVGSYNAAIRACEKGRWQCALQRMESMQTRNMEPDVVS